MSPLFQNKCADVVCYDETLYIFLPIVIIVYWNEHVRLKSIWHSSYNEVWTCGVKVGVTIVGWGHVAVSQLAGGLGRTALPEWTGSTRVPPTHMSRSRSPGVTSAHVLQDVLYMYICIVHTYTQVQAQ